MRGTCSRREAMASAGILVASGLVDPQARARAEMRPEEPFRYSLNTSTLRGQKLPIAETVAIAAKAGFHAVEPWISELEQHKATGSLKDLGKKIADLGLTVESAIGFAPWIVDDEERRAKGVEQMKREMEMVADIGGKRIAAPAAGANDKPGLDLRAASDRYRVICEAGDQIGVVPEMEFWGSARSMSTLADAAFVALRSGHPKACILADIYHLYKGGSGFDSVRLLSGQAIHVIHANDYPADPPRETVTDAHRVYPGDGTAPLGTFFRNLKAIGFSGHLSVELFNREYWKQDPQTVAQTALEKTRSAVRKAFA